MAKLSEKGDYKRALKILEDLLTDDEENSAARRARAHVYDQMGDEKHALQEYRELERLSAENERWAARLTVLKELVEHHVEEEEGEIFTKARSLLDRTQERELGTAFLQQKKVVLAELRKG